MQDIYTERKALRDYLKQINEERRRLADEYWTVINRLRELDDKLNQDGNTELVEKLMEMIELQGNTIGLLKEKIPNVPIEVVVENWKEKFHQEETPKVSTQDIEKEKDKAVRTAVIRKSKYKDLKSLADMVTGFLRDMGRPVATKEIEKFLESKHYKVSNPTNTLKQMMGHNPKIQKAARGFYQYKN